MPITVQQIKEEIKELRGQAEILHSAKEHEARIALHSETSISEKSTIGLSGVLNFAKSVLIQDKYQMFLSLIRFPVPTVSLMSEVYAHFQKVFDGRNGVYSARFDNEEEAAYAYNDAATKHFGEFAKLNTTKEGTPIKKGTPKETVITIKEGDKEVALCLNNLKISVNNKSVSLEELINNPNGNVQIFGRI